MHCQFKNGCNNFAHTRCSVLWSRTHGQNVHDLESVGRFCQEHYLDYDKNVLPNQTNNGTQCPWTWPPKEKDLQWNEPDMSEFVANGLWFAPNCKECFLTNKFITSVIRFADTPGKNRDLIRQEITSCFHWFTGIRASIKMSSRNHSFKLNCSQLHQWKKTQCISPALSWAKTSLMAAWKNWQ